MIPASTLRRLVSLGLSQDQSDAVAEMLCEVEHATEAKADERARMQREQNAERQRQWRKRQDDITLRNVMRRYAQENQGVNESEVPVASRARVDDSSKPLEDTGQSIIGLSQVSNETFERLVPEPKKERKDQVELFQTVVAMWNDLAAALRLVSVRDITNPRQSAILARSNDLTKTYDFPDPLAGWRALMGFVRGSPFLRGETREGFRCDFDFVTRASSFTKIMEGKYEARTTSVRR